MSRTPALLRNEHAVVIAGGGPTGLMLAGSRAGGMHSRTIEVLGGIADRFPSEGQLHKAAHFHAPLDLSDFPTRHNYVLGLSQNHIERILAGWVSELEAPIYRGPEVAGFKRRDRR